MVQYVAFNKYTMLKQLTRNLDLTGTLVTIACTTKTEVHSSYSSSYGTNMIYVTNVQLHKFLPKIFKLYISFFTKDCDKNFC